MRIRKYLDAGRYVGKRFGKLTVVSAKNVRTQTGRAITELNCICDCGNNYITHPYPPARSCGCQRHFFKDKEKAKKIRSSWRSMMGRCYNVKHENYKYYGGRGVMVCEKWMDFRSFYADTQSTWSEGKTIDRYPNQKGNYEPNNYRWATQQEQSENRSILKLNREKAREIKSSSLSYKELSNKFGVNISTISRIKTGKRWA
jgi:hypothetical protein